MSGTVLRTSYLLNSQLHAIDIIIITTICGWWVWATENLAQVMWMVELEFKLCVAIQSLFLTPQLNTCHKYMYIFSFGRRL